MAQEPVQTKHQSCLKRNTLWRTHFLVVFSPCDSWKKAENICCHYCWQVGMYTRGKSAEEKGAISFYIYITDRKETSRGSTKERGNWQEQYREEIYFLCRLTDSTGHTRVNSDVLKHCVFFWVLWRNGVCFNELAPL